MMFRFILVLSLLFVLIIESYSQSSCNNSAPFCTSTGVTFPASTNTTAPVGPDYGCLGSQPNPAWYYLNISTGGNIDITLTNSANVDIDFAAWGPFASQAAMQAAVCGGTSGSPIDCSFSAAATEVVSLPNTQPGEWYMLLITNFSGQPTNITATQTGGSGATNCAILCNMTGLTAVPGACNPANNQYDVTGTINVTNPPATGTLTITNSCGGSTVINPPFASSINYTIPGVTANGANCTITATFSADPTCTLTQNYTAPPSCTATCNITGLTAVPGACNPANNQYDVTGTINVTNPPATGTLTITNSCGGSTVINPPFASSINYTIPGVSANGTNCTITATFSAAPTCTLTQNYTAPPSCTVSCNINNFTANIGTCQPNNTYTVNGTIDFTTGITTDSLVITINDGINKYDTIIYPPYVSPMNWSISGMNSNGNNITITATFAADPSCTASLNSTAPAACGCVAQIGNFNINMTGNGTTNYILCFGDQINIASNIGYNPPAVANNPPGPAYNPGIGYLIYSCPPTIGTVPSNVPPHDDITNDPCFVGVVGFGSSFSDINTNGQPSWVGPWTNNTLYYVPITFYDTISGTYSYVNTSMPCYDMGNPIAVQYLPEIVSSNPTEDCLDSSFTITITGGLPAINGSNFTASNLSPANASFVNTTTPNGGTIQINGLLNGDMYSFDVIDDNGCPITISGGPFVGLPNANAGVDDTSCVLTYTLNAIPSIGTGSWSGPAGVVFNPVNSPTATVTVPSAGTYNFTWTETNTAACVTSDVVTITFSNLSESTVTTPSTCSANDGTITITAIDGVSPYQYSINGGTTFQAGNTFSNLAANTYNIVVEDAVGCQVTASYTVNSIAGPTINSSNFTDPTCNGDCDGTVTVTGTSPAGGEQYSIDGINFQASGTFNNLCAGTYTVTISDANSCTDTVSLTLTDPDSVTISASDVTICTGQSATLTATASGGSGSGYTYNWNNGASTTSSYTVSPPATTNYPVFAIDGNGCTSPTINVTVTVTPPLSVVASPSDTSICPGESVIIYATPFFGNGGPYTYLWSNGSTDSSQVVTPATTTVYTVTLNDGCSPPTTGTVTINVMPLPQVSFTADKFEACETPVETFTFYNTTDTTGGMVGSSIWDFGDGNSAVGDTVTHAYNNAGTYDVTLTITSSAAAGGCTNSVTYPNYITIHQNPTADFYMKDNPANMLNPIVSFHDQSYFNIVGWAWDIGGLDSSYIQNPTYEFPVDTGHYPITLTVIDDNGCMGTITKILEVEGEFGIYIPNAFTPDFDFLNEGFGPKGFGISEINYSFFIFDRWGEIIYESHTLFEPWNGTYKGKFVQNGVYVWKLEFQDINGKNHSKIGHVNVIR